MSNSIGNTSGHGVRGVFVGLALIAALSLAGCKLAPAGYGTLEGKVSIGPLCPVERNPPDPACLPTKETYAAWAIAVYTADSYEDRNPVAELSPVPPEGTYSLALPAGDYIVDRKLIDPGGLGYSNLPSAITISADKSTTLEIEIDTGMR